MKTNFLLSILFIGLFTQISYSQTLEEKPKVSSSLVFKINNLYQGSSKSLSNHYALGGEIGIYFSNKIYIGIAQYSSLAPSDIRRNNHDKQNKTRRYEYSLQTAYHFPLSPLLYLNTGFRLGYSALHLEYNHNNGVDSDETKTKDKLSSPFVAPDLKLGIRLHRCVSLEGGINYHQTLKNKTKWGISNADINGLAGTISLIANIPM